MINWHASFKTSFYFYQKTLSFLLSIKSINENDIDDVFKSVYNTVISNMQKNLGQDSGWIIDSVLEHTINFSKYNSLAGISYIKFPKKKTIQKKIWLIFRILVRHLNPADHNFRRSTKCHKDFAKRIEIKAIKSWVKTRDFHKIERRTSLALALSVMKIS